VPEGHDDNKQNVILNRVDDAGVADTDPYTGAALERLGSGWSRILTEQRDGTTDSVAILMIYVL
jgi:hypothetical protein